MSLAGIGERLEDGAFHIHYYMKNGKGTLTKKGYESIKDLERQLAEARDEIESYKYDLETLVSVVSDCLNKMSGEECYDTLKQVADHYKKLKEQGR